MAGTRITVSADEADLALLRATAARTGTSPSALIREAIHREAQALQVWDAPIVTETFDFGGPDRYDTGAIRDAVVEAVQDRTRR